MQFIKKNLQSSRQGNPKKLINETWNKLNLEFPNWKKNKILNTVNIGKNKYMRTINKFTYKIYATIFSI